MMIPLFVQTASAQIGSGSSVGGLSDKSGKPVMSAVGKPCLDIEAGARTHNVNRNVVDHIVSIKNGCPRVIQTRICYLNSDRCSNVRIGSYERVDTVLGTAVGQKIFNYKVFQQ
jgi:hypothetical protein